MQNDTTATAPTEVDRNVWETNADRVQPHEAAVVRGSDGSLVWGMRVREVRANSREVDFAFSTPGVKRDGFEIDQSTWQLDGYLANPVVLFAHDSHSIPIGRAKNVGVMDGELRGTVEFATKDISEDADRVFRAVESDFMRTGSVGFIAHTIRFEMRDDVEIAVLADVELLEFSITPVPADAGAVARRRVRDMASAKSNPPTQERGGVTATPTKESKVDKLDEVRAALESKTAEAEKISRDCDSERAKVAELQERCATLETERNERQSQINDLTIAAVKRDLEALVGKKIAPTEVDGLAKLATLDRGLYDTQLEAIKARPDMGIVREAPVVTPDAAPPQTGSAEAGASVDLFAVAQSGAKEA